MFPTIIRLLSQGYRVDYKLVENFNSEAKVNGFDPEFEMRCK